MRFSDNIPPTGLFIVKNNVGRDTRACSAITILGFGTADGDRRCAHIFRHTRPMPARTHGRARYLTYTSTECINANRPADVCRVRVVDRMELHVRRNQARSQVKGGGSMGSGLGRTSRQIILEYSNVLHYFVATTK